MSCAKGQILRVGYTTRKGVKVKPTCIKDRGKPGKGPKTLPDTSGDLHLTDYGYKTALAASTRRAALRRASQAEGTLAVLRHLNLIRNKQASGSDAKNIMSEDVNYMKQYYSREQSGGYTYYSSNHSYSGGDVWSSSTSYSSVSDGINDSFSFTKEVNGKSIEFYSLDLPNNERGIGVNADGELKGVLHYSCDADTIIMHKYTVEKGFNTALLTFASKHFKTQGYKHIIIVIKADRSEKTKEKLNFWLGKGFTVLKSDDKIIKLGANL